MIQAGPEAFATSFVQTLEFGEPFQSAVHFLVVECSVGAIDVPCRASKCRITLSVTFCHRWFAERPRVVQHEWDPNNPDDPVFLVQPDGGVGLAYQIPGTPSAKSVSLGTFAERQRPPRARLAALRSCACMATPAVDENEAQSPDAGGSDGSDSLTISSGPVASGDRPRGAQGRSAPRNKAGVFLPHTQVCKVTALPYSTSPVVSDRGGSSRSVQTPDADMWSVDECVTSTRAQKRRKVGR